MDPGGKSQFTIHNSQFTICRQVGGDARGSFLVTAGPTSGQANLASFDPAHRARRGRSAPHVRSGLRRPGHSRRMHEVPGNGAIISSAPKANNDLRGDAATAEPVGLLATRDTLPPTSVSAWRATP